MCSTGAYFLLAVSRAPALVRRVRKGSRGTHRLSGPPFLGAPHVSRASETSEVGGVNPGAPATSPLERRESAVIVFALRLPLESCIRRLGALLESLALLLGQVSSRHPVLLVRLPLATWQQINHSRLIRTHHKKPE